MDFKEVQSFIKFVTKSGASEVSLETEEYKITVKSGSDQRTVIATPQAPPVITMTPSTLLLRARLKNQDLKTSMLIAPL